MGWTSQVGTVQRLGFAPIKGTRHTEFPQLQISADGPVGDRRFCLIDPARRQVLRTVQNPALTAVLAWCQDRELSCRFPDGTTIAAPVAVTGPTVSFDYWGRAVEGQVVDGPWAAAFGDYLGTTVALVACSPGDVVFGDSLTVITTSSLQAFARRAGRTIEPARLRATVLIDDRLGDDPTDSSRLDDPVESHWVGQDLLLGTAVIRVTSAVARCAVIDIDPVTGRRDGHLFRRLVRETEHEKQVGDPLFGIQATVKCPGVISTGDPARLAAAVDIS